MLASLLNLVFNGLTASIGNLNAKESKEKKVQFLYSLNLINFWVFGLAAIGIFVVSSDLVALFYGQRFVLPNNIPFVIALNFYMVGMQNAVWTYKNTMGLFRQGRYLLLLTAGINLVCSIVLGNIWGLFGILFATAISRALTNTWYDPYAVFRYGLAEPVWPYYKRYIQFAVIEAGCAFLCFELSKLLQFNLFVNIMVKCVICVVLPSVVFFIVFHNWKEFEYCKNLVNRILSKFKRSH